MGTDPTTTAAPEPVYGKPFHGWSCECDECQGYDERGEPRPGEAPTTTAAYESVLYGWLLERKGEVVRVVCTFCRYSFVRRMDDSMREFVETAAQHEC